MRRFRSYLLLAPLALLVVACPLPTIPQAAPAQDTPVAVAMDAASGRAVLVMSSGARLPIAATEADGATVSAADAAGIVLVPDGTSAKGLSGGKSAIIFGTRSDGKPGIWIYSGSQFDPVIDEDSGKETTALAESKDRDGAFRGAFGWQYHIVAWSEDGQLFAGYAEATRDFTFRGISVDKGTTVGVYWTLKRVNKHGFVLSRAHIIGSLDPVKIADANHHVLRWLSNAARHTVAQLKLFLLGYYDSYLVMVDANGTHVNAAGTLYSVSGTDQDGQPAVATIDNRGRVTITEVTPPPPPPPATPTGLTVSGATTTSLDVSWDASTTGATSYQVYRDTAADGAFTSVAFDGSATSFTDSGLTPATIYYYRARATGDGGSSALSAAVSGTTVPLVTGTTVALAADINTTTTPGSSPQSITSYNGAVYFAANDGTGDGSQLFMFNGSTATKVISGVSNFNPKYLTVYSGKLYFQASNGGPKLYSFDGANLVAVSPTVNGPQYLAVMDGVLYMGATEVPPVYGSELWRYDVNNPPAVYVADINGNGNAGSSPAQIVAMGSELYFSATDGTSRQLWKSDGSPTGTTSMVGTGVSGGSGIAPASPITIFNSALYFAANDGTGTYLYTTDGVTTPTPVPGSIQVQTASPMAVFSGALYMAATDGSDGYELYKWDGVSLGRVTDLTPGSGSGLGPTVSFGVLNGALYFGGATDGTNYQMYKYDGSSVTLVQTINAGGNANPTQFGVVLPSRLYFQATDGATGAELWVLY